MVTREAGFFGNLVETERVIVTVIDKLARPTKPLERFNVRQISVFDSFGPLALRFCRQWFLQRSLDKLVHACVAALMPELVVV